MTQQALAEEPHTLITLLDYRDPAMVRGEIAHIWSQVFPHTPSQPVTDAFNWTVDLFTGKVDGFASCSTEYHDLQHATDTCLALARMIHGARAFGINLTPGGAKLALIAALLHDAGFIQDAGDNEGTGAKHTKIHVARSIGVMRYYAALHKWSAEERDFAERLITATDLLVDPEKLPGEDQDDTLLARMLAAADLWAQMSDRIYLEKLVALYYELREGGVDYFRDDEDIILKTPGFYVLVEHRLRRLAPVIDGFLRIHFRERWDIDDNLYRIAIERQREYLQEILKVEQECPSRFLRRDGYVDKIRERYAEG